MAFVAIVHVGDLCNARFMLVGSIAMVVFLRNARLAPLMDAIKFVRFHDYVAMDVQPVAILKPNVLKPRA